MDPNDRYETKAYSQSRDRRRDEHARHDLAAGRQDAAEVNKPDLGARVQITGVMPDEKNPIPIGTEGTVTWVGPWAGELPRQIGVDWDNGSTLILLGSDPYRILTGPNPSA